MKHISHCPVCEREARSLRQASLAAFIRHRIQAGPGSQAHLLECTACGLRFSSLRLDDSEVGRLYDQYREAGYLADRQRFEPWYTDAVNRSLGEDTSITRLRRDLLAQLLQASGHAIPVAALLDYGGDQGQRIPPGMAKTAYLYDISGKPPVAGVQALSEADLSTHRFDLVLLAQVLEHVMEPVKLVRDVAAILPEGGLLYLEVPLERPLLLGRGRLAFRPGRMAQAHDFLSTATREALGCLPWGALCKISEHVNFFDEGSLSALVQQAGLRLEGIGVTPGRRLFGRFGTLAALASRPGPTPE